jgi:methyl-accepting chemotaxis protein
MVANISRKLILIHTALAALLIATGTVSTLAIDYGHAHRMFATTTFLWVIWITISVGASIALFGGHHLHSVICGGLARQRRKFAEVADTLDLSNRSASPRKDEFGKCATEFDRFMGRIDKTISSVQLSTDTVAVATRQIAAGNIDLSARTEQQAASLEETAATLKQLTIAVSRNADNARNAFEVADSATKVASLGNSTVQALVNSIGTVKTSSTQISAITSLIEGIAFQTNILALNAAVESARAGELGRGFAVVASEVRNLAQRTSVAAKEIATLVSSSSELVEKVARQATDAGKTMTEVQGGVMKVSEVVGDIANACELQQDAIRQIDVAVSDMEAMTQQNAALVEQSAASTHSLSEQMENLKATVGVFTLSSPEGP